MKRIKITTNFSLTNNSLYFDRFDYNIDTKIRNVYNAINYFQL